MNEDIKTKQDLLFEVSSLNTQLSNELIKNEKLQQRIDKAIKYIEETPIGRILPVHYWQEKDYTEPLLKILKELEEGNSNDK